ncbi:alpha/beta fold hydrolase [Dechloromonas sp. ARDL1]|uniref:alpha/beta hydrolase family protein n=1 Tax=Dechloromonas sp. ARDL1 TaxID=3322121 RepID=UPI003DA74BA7
MPASPRDFQVVTADHLLIGASEWRHDGEAGDRNVVVIAPATSVKARYYYRFADYLHASGCDVVTFDYRGIGASRPPGGLRRFNASYVDWGRHDLEAVLQYVSTHYPGQPIDVVAHSIGGFTLGLAASSHRVRRALTVGAQIAYWPDYNPRKRLQMLLRWHLFMPLVARLFGYFPGARLGWLEDTPLGIVRQWSALHRDFEKHPWKTHRSDPPLPLQFELFRGETLAISLADDDWGTPAAIRRLLGLYKHARRHHLHLAPTDIGVSQIGHFAYFNSKFADSLWPAALQWIQTGAMPAPFQSRLLKVV